MDSASSSKTNVRIGRFYDWFSVVYPLIDIFQKREKRKLMEEINALPPGALLEVGVGNGCHLAAYKGHQVTGIDISAAMLAKARRNKIPGLELLRMDGEQLSFADRRFNYVVLSHMLSVTHDADRVLEEVYRVLAPDGMVFIVNHFTPGNWLRYIDRSFGAFSGLIHFRSVFYLKHLRALQKFNFIKEVSVGLFSYIKLYIFQKPSSIPGGDPLCANVSSQST